MTNDRFKAFESKMWTADKNDGVWWDGYNFLDLTRKQSNRVCSILRARGFETVEDGEIILMPSGLGIREVKEF